MLSLVECIQRAFISNEFNKVYFTDTTFYNKFDYARRYCGSFVGNLWQPSFKAEQGFVLLNEESQPYYWLGITESSSKSITHYLSGLPINWTNWKSDQPDGSVIVNVTDGLWSDKTKRDKNGVLCEGKLPLSSYDTLNIRTLPWFVRRFVQKFIESVTNSSTVEQSEIEIKAITPEVVTELDQNLGQNVTLNQLMTKLDTDHNSWNQTLSLMSSQMIAINEKCLRQSNELNQNLTRVSKEIVAFRNEIGTDRLMRDELNQQITELRMQLEQERYDRLFLNCKENNR